MQVVFELFHITINIRVGLATLFLGNTALLVRGFLSKLGFVADFLYVWVQLVGRSKPSSIVNDIG
jgi:hypothetical protein